MEVLHKVSDALTKLDNFKPENSCDISVNKAFFDSGCPEKSFGIQSDSDSLLKKEQNITIASDNETSSVDYDSVRNSSDSDANNDENSVTMDEFNSNASLEASENNVIGNNLLDSSLKWKSDIIQNARDSFIERQFQTTNLWKLIYGKFRINNNICNTIFSLKYFEHMVDLFSILKLKVFYLYEAFEIFLFDLLEESTCIMNISCLSMFLYQYLNS